MIQPSSQIVSAKSAVKTADPIVLCAADERYAMPLAVTLMTAGESLAPGKRLNVFLVDGGFQEQSRQMLKETLASLPIHLEFVPLGNLEVRDLGISHHISHAAYLRLFADRWLPAEVDKVIYLDADLIVRSSLTELWDVDLGSHCCLAVPDIACPYIDARQSPAEFKRYRPYVAVYEPIRNYRDFGLTGREYYFNSGVMVLDVRKWREEALGQHLLSCLRNHSEFVWCWDQYALNAVLAGKWGRLPLKWNAGTHAFEYPPSQPAPFESDEFQEMLTEPAIIHFTTEFKPWDFDNVHPWRDLYFSALDRTAWRGWRPTKPPFSVSRLWQKQAIHWTRQAIVLQRKVSAWRGQP